MGNTYIIVRVVSAVQKQMWVVSFLEGSEHLEEKVLNQVTPVAEKDEILGKPHIGVARTLLQTETVSESGIGESSLFSLTPVVATMRRRRKLGKPEPVIDGS